MARASMSWDTLGPLLIWQFLIPLVIYHSYILIATY
jgi:hypothetical protein